MPLGAQYAPALAQLIAQEGMVRADAERRKGELWGDYLGNVGPQTLAMYTGLQDRRADRAEQQQSTMDATREKAKKDLETIARDYGAIEFAPPEQRDQALAVTIRRWRAQGIDPGPLAEQPYNPAIAEAFRASGMTPSQQASELRARATDAAGANTRGLEQMKLEADLMPKPVEPQNLINVPAGGAVLDPVTRQPVFTNPRAEPDQRVTFGAPTAAMVGGQRVFVRPGSDGKTYDLRGQVVAGDPVPIPPEPSQPGGKFWVRRGPNMIRITEAEYQPGDQPADTAFMRNMDAGKGRATSLLESVVELAERINVNKGLYAKMAGGAAKVAAKANYDDDVAEYEAMVKAFTPLWARALGHVGILTQVDVDSAREALPRPGDGKPLMKRKIARIEKILGTTIAGSDAADAAAGGPAPGTQPAGAGRIYYDANGDPVSR